MHALEYPATRLHYMQANYRTVKNLTIDDESGLHIDIKTAIILRSYTTDVVIYDVQRNHAYMLPCYKYSRTTSKQRGTFLMECTSLPVGVWYAPKRERDKYISFLTNPKTNLSSLSLYPSAREYLTTCYY